MSWKIERTRVLPPKYEWELYLSAYGYAAGWTFTRWGAERSLRRVQSDWFAQG